MDKEFNLREAFTSTFYDITKFDARYNDNHKPSSGVSEGVLILRVDKNDKDNYECKIIHSETNKVLDSKQYDKFGEVVDVFYNLQFQYGFNNVEMERGWID